MSLSLSLSLSVLLSVSLSPCLSVSLSLSVLRDHECHAQLKTETVETILEDFI